MTFDYEGWLKTAEDRLEVLYEQKAQIEGEITMLENGIDGFAPLLNRPTRWVDSDANAGITETILAILRNTPSRLFTPTEIRDGLVARGVALTQRNPMATIHQTLSRLAMRNAVKVVALESGRSRYQWIEEAEQSDPAKALSDVSGLSKPGAGTKKK